MILRRSLPAMVLLLSAAAAAADGVTACDRIAAHPDDPDRVAPCVERAAIDLEPALATCTAEAERDPANARTR